MTHALPADELARLERYARAVAYRHWARRQRGGQNPIVGEPGDYVSSTLTALALALSRYDPAKGPALPFVSRSIKGALLNEERFWDGRQYPDGLGVHAYRRPECLDALRFDGEEERWLDALVDMDADPLRAVLAGEAGERARALLAYLTPKEREVFEPYYWDHLSAREIGAQIGLTKSAVEMRLRTGLRRLRGILAPAPETEDV